MSISIPGADYTPQLTGYTGQGAFRFWCQKVLPIVYDDSLSYYELLNKVVNYLNNVIADVASVENNIEQLNTSYVSLQNFVNETNDDIETEISKFETLVSAKVRVLQDFVNHYFDNLDVQQEINNKLDAMASDGSLTALLNPLIANEAPDVIEQWLTEHITPTTPIIDSSLTVSGAGADAKVVGDKFTTTYDTLLSSNSNNEYKVNLTDGKYIGYTDGDEHSFEGLSASDYIAVLPGCRIELLNIGVSVGNSGLAFYDSQYQFISAVQSTGTSLKAYSPSSARYFRFTCKTENIGNYGLFMELPNDSTVQSWNLYDTLNPSTFTDEKYIDSQGILHNLRWSYVTDYLPVVPKSYFIMNHMNEVSDARGFAFFDRNKKFVYGLSYNYGNLISGFVPNNACYVRLTINKTNRVSPSIYFTTGDTNESEFSAAMMANPGNIRRTTNFTTDFYVNYQTGVVSALTEWSASDFIPVLPGCRIYISNCGDSVDLAGLAFYDHTFGYVSGLQSADGFYFGTAPTTARYFRFSCRTANRNTAVIFLDAPNNNTVESFNVIDTLDSSKFVRNCYIGSDGYEHNFAYADSTTFLSIVPGSYLWMLQMNENHDGRGFALYDRDKNLVYGGTYNYGNLIALRVPDNVFYIRFTVNHDQVCKSYVYANLVANIDTKFTANMIDEIGFTEGYYLNYLHGGISALGKQKASDFLAVAPKGYYYVDCHTSMVNSNIGMAFYDRSKTFVSGIQYQSGKACSGFVPDGCYYMRFTWTEGRENPVAIIPFSTDGEESFNVLACYDNITCIGDSLTYGQVYTASNASRRSYKTYPEVLSVLTGANVITLAHTGYNAIQCWSDYGNLISSKTNQLTIIYLGTNDGFTDSVATDCSDANFENWANTNTGCLGKLIAKSLSVGSRVLLVKPWITSADNLTSTLKAIDDLCEKLNVACIDSINLKNRRYHSYPNSTGFNSVHYNDLGYSAFAQELCNMVSKLPYDMTNRIQPV